MTRSLPSNPSLENLRKQAKTLQKQWAAGEPAALARIQAVRPRHDQPDASGPRLSVCQLVIARELGFESWPRLKVAVRAANLESADQFVTLACLCHDDPHYDHRSFPARASQMLQDNPSLSEANIWSAVAAGNVYAVGRLLDRHPDLVDRPGVHGWVPLICACYSRVRPTLEVARLLLDRGADPNAFTMKGNADERLDQTPRRFTALTGVFGGGSTGLANQPPHPQWRELAELLLERGASPADEQALWINPGDSLEILLGHGLKPDDLAPAGISLMGRELCRAARQGDLNRVRLLLAHHARLDEKFEGRTPWQHATEHGNLEIARLLEQAGAPAAGLTEVEHFVALCLAGDERGVRALLDREPDLLARAPKDMVQRAVDSRRPEAVRLVLDLGFDPNWVEDNAPIHMSGILARSPEILRLLLSRGASLKLRDPWYDGTGIGAADFFHETALRDFLLQQDGVDLFDALDFDRLDLVPGILERDPAALERPFARCLSREPQPRDWHTPLTRMVMRGKTEAVRTLLELGADRSARHPDGRGLVQVARDAGFEEIAALLESQKP